MKRLLALLLILIALAPTAQALERAPGSSQKVMLFAFTTADNTPKTGDAANISCYQSIDGAAVAQLTDTSASEMDSTNLKGWYVFDITSAETDGKDITIGGKSSTAGVTVVGRVYTTTAPNSAKQVVDSSGRIDLSKIAGQTASASGTVTFPNATLASTTNITAASGIDVTKWNGTTVPTSDVAGYPKVTVDQASGVEANGRGGRWWYLSASGNNSNAGTKSSPRLTLGSVNSAMANNDSIFYLDGTYSMSAGITISKKNIHIVGQSTAGVIINYTHDGSNDAAIKVTGSGANIRNLKVTTTGDGWPIQFLDVHDITLENCELDAPLDGLAITKSSESVLRNYVIRGNKISCDYDGVVIYNVAGLLFEGNHVTTRSTYANSATANNRGLLIFQSQGLISGNYISADVPASGSNITGGTAHELIGISADGECSLTLRDNVIVSRSTLTSYNGNVIGIRSGCSGSAPTQKCNVTVASGNLIKTSQAGSSATTVLDAMTTGTIGGIVLVDSKTVDSTKISGSVYLLPDKLIDTLADTNELQGDWANGGRLDNILDARASQTSVDAVDDFVDTEVSAIKTKTDFLPSATAGTDGGVVIAGSNAATTFATLTSTGAFTINGTSMVAQTGDSFARIGATGSGLTSLAPSATALSTATWTGTKAGYLDAAISSISAGTSPTILQSGTITVSGGQTAPVLSAGSADNDAYNNQLMIIVDQSTSTQKDSIAISDYVGSSKTITLARSPIFTIATGDSFYIVAAPPATVSGIVDANLVQIGGVTQSATDLKDFADAGYDPTTNTVTGIFGTINDFDELLSGSDDFDTAFQASATTFFGSTGGNMTSLASQSSVDTIDDLLDTEVAAIKTKTDYLPSATAGAAGGVLVAGSNAATTFTTLTSSGAFSINGTSMVAQTGDSFARIGSNGGSLTSLATASAQTSQGSILNKLDASFASSGVFSTGALANAPTGTGEGGGLTPEQEGWLEDAYDNSVSIKAKTDNLPSDPADASVLAGLIGSPLVTLAADIASSRTSLETKVDNIEIEAAGMLTDVNQDPVGASQLFLAVRKAGGLVGDEARTITVGTVPLLGVDFRNVAPTGRQITNAEDWEIVSGTAGGLTFGDVGRDKQMSKCSVTAVTPGTYRVRVRVTFYGGAIDTCVITIKVAAL